MRDGLAALLVMLAAGLAPLARPSAPPGPAAAAAPAANAAAQKPSPPGESQKVAAMPTPKMYFGDATRDPTMKTQMLALAAGHGRSRTPARVADRMSDFGRAAWKQVGDGPVLKPERPWETRCIEAPSVVRRDGTLYLFYGGGYNNDPQQDRLRYQRRRRALDPPLPGAAPAERKAGVVELFGIGPPRRLRR